MHSYRPLVCGPRSSRDVALARLITHLRTPLYRNGYALVLSSATTSVLGMAYWFLAARTYTPDVVGLNAAAIAAMGAWNDPAPPASKEKAGAES